MPRTHTKRFLAAGAVLAAAAIGGTSIVTASSANQAAPQATGYTHADLVPLNNSGVTGTADAHVHDNKLEVDLDARHLLRGMPHAEHIHFGAQARQECPSVRDDDNHDHRLNTAEGLPAYGPVKVSLTTKGDTSPKSTLAVTRYPLAKKGTIHYNRQGIDVSPRVARAIRHGKAVLVIHGIDYNGNGKYDFSAGRSELDPSLPAEATDPVTCGVLQVADAPASTQSEPSTPGLPALPLRDER
ncbi:MAG TPA: hypothetical protein VFT70_17930 [Nocardioides sp.]|nr:hypothetical protein [Nocardioides sp.]